jgi:hypothetical protein
MLKDKTNADLVNMIGDPSFTAEQSEIKEEILTRLNESPLRRAYATWVDDSETFDGKELTEEERDRAIGIMVENGWLNEQISDVASDAISDVISERLNVETTDLEPAK